MSTKLYADIEFDGLAWLRMTMAFHQNLIYQKVKANTKICSMSYTRYHATHRIPSVIFVAAVVVVVVADVFYYDEGEQQQQQHENINIDAIILKNIRRRRKNYA